MHGYFTLYVWIYTTSNQLKQTTKNLYLKQNDLIMNWCVDNTKQNQLKYTNKTFLEQKFRIKKILDNFCHHHLLKADEG